MSTITFLTDYKGFFGSKATAVPYRSGFDQALLLRHLEHLGHTVRFLPLADVDPTDPVWRGSVVVPTSSEDPGTHYKGFIEDVAFALERRGAVLVPSFGLIRAHHNKVLMEMLGAIAGIPTSGRLAFRAFPTFEDLRTRLSMVKLPAVIKPAQGSMSQGVELVRTQKELLRFARRISRTHDWFLHAWDLVRRLRRPGYVRESWNRGRFILQEFLPGLREDWKLLVFGARIFVLHRDVRPNDFRASGSGRFTWPEEVDPRLLAFAARCREALDTPVLSLDVAWDGSTPKLLEWQALFFGTIGVDVAPHSFVLKGRRWSIERGRSVLEEQYALALNSFLRSKKLNHP